MLKKTIEETPVFVAGDQTMIREVLHPKNEDIVLPYSLAYATLAPGQSSRPHILATSVEAYVIVKGNGRAFINGDPTSLKPGDVIHIPAGAQQYVKNTGETTLEFWCIVSPPWSKSDELVL